MELCIENGLEVISNTQVNRKNVHTMMPTARLLNDVGVRGMRIIRTTEAPRWEENAANSCLDLEEYYRSMLDFAVEYSKSGMMMEMEIWQYIGLLPRQQSYYLKPVKFANSERRGDGYCCNCNHTMVAVTSRRRDHASTTAAGNAVPWAFCVSCHTHSPGNVVMAAQERVQRRIGETPRRTAPPAYRRMRWGVV